MSRAFVTLFFALATALTVSAQEDATGTSPVTTTSTTTTTTTTAQIYIPKPNTTVCYDNLGCFDNNYPFNNTGLYVPAPPEVVNTNFLLYTNAIENDTDTLSYLDVDMLLQSRYNKQYPLKIVIHGFQNTGFTPWVPWLARNLTIGAKGKVNVITVDWGDGAIFPLYNNASTNTRLVARQTCKLVKLIRKTFYQDTWTKDFNIHCIGHSLGAHTCGYTSNECDNAFDRITAMDPAGPFFESYDYRVRIDPSDAKFVDVIHSNGDNLLTGNFGMSLACGHVDFYPNGGKQQPGCPSITSTIIGLFTNASAAMSGASCSHARAIDYFTESINTPCTFLGYPCDSLASFEKGDCLDCSKGGCTFMGYHASTKSRGIKYMLTRSTKPYCAYPYLLEITISVLEKQTAGEIIYWLEADGTNATAAMTKQSDNIVSNTTYRKVFVSEMDILEVDRMYIKFLKKPKPLFGADTNAPEIYIDKIRISHGEVDDEVYSQCSPNLKIADKEQKAIDLKFSDCQIKLNRKRRDNKTLQQVLGM